MSDSKIGPKRAGTPVLKLVVRVEGREVPLAEWLEEMDRKHGGIRAIRVYRNGELVERQEGGAPDPEERS